MGNEIMTTAQKSTYRSTESKYKGGANEMYVTYDLNQRTRGGGSAQVPKVKRVYIAGVVQGWKVGDFRKRTGREVHGVRIEYEQTRRRFQRKAYHARREQTEYDVAPAGVPKAKQRFAQIVELPARARNVEFRADRQELPERFRHALQNVR
jgi:hypothetical protein